MKNADTSKEIPVSKKLSALKKLKASTKPTIEIMKHIYLPQVTLLQRFLPL